MIKKPTAASALLRAAAGYHTSTFIPKMMTLGILALNLLMTQGKRAIVEWVVRSSLASASAVLGKVRKGTNVGQRAG